MAYTGPIARWIIEQSNLNLWEQASKGELNKAVKKTWFCPITDSMKINSFYHINNIPGRYDIRPDWNSLSELEVEKGIKRYIEEKSIERIVLVEDFVGSGNQISGALNFAFKNFIDAIPILCVPLIVCPKGVMYGRRCENKHENFTFSPVLEIKPEILVAEVPSNDEPEIYTLIRDLVLSVDRDLYGETRKHNRFGFNGTGSLVVLHTNTPNNSLPIIHWRSQNWTPLFPRHSRV